MTKALILVTRGICKQKGYQLSDVCCQLIVGDVDPVVWTTFYGWVGDEGADASMFVARICRDTPYAPPSSPRTSPFPIMLAFFWH